MEYLVNKLKFRNFKTETRVANTENGRCRLLESQLYFAKQLIYVATQRVTSEPDGLIPWCRGNSGANQRTRMCVYVPKGEKNK